MDSPIMVRSAGDEQYAGCTGFPADSHTVTWLGVGILIPAAKGLC
jgi:cytochrome c oxidase subunit 5b